MRRPPGEVAVFDGWGGACAGADGCSLVVTGDVSVEASFTALRNYVFVTSGQLNPWTIGSAEAADAFCQAAAEAGDARLSGRTYIAWLSTSTRVATMSCASTAWRSEWPEERARAGAWEYY